MTLLISCAVPIKTIEMSEQNDYSEKRHSKLKIFMPDEYIEYKHLKIAIIIIENSFINGDLIYDERAERYLLESMNEVGADALILDPQCSNSIKTCFYAIHYTEDYIIYHSGDSTSFTPDSTFYPISPIFDDVSNE